MSTVRKMTGRSPAASSTSRYSRCCRSREGRVAETRNWNSVRNRPIPRAPVRSSAAISSRRPALIINSIGTPSRVTAGISRSDARLARRFCEISSLASKASCTACVGRTCSAPAAASSSIRSPSRIDARTSLTRPSTGTPIARATMMTCAVSEPSSRTTPFSRRRSYSSSSAGPRLRAIRIESCLRPICAAVPICPDTMRISRFDRSSRSCMRSRSSGSSIWRIRIRVRCWTRSIAASAVRPLSIASLIRRDQPSS